MFERILIPARGEAGARVARTCRRIGADTIAAGLPGDAESVYAQACDAFVVLEARAAPQWVAVAGEQRCEAVHPGYGDTAESLEFSRAVERAGLRWIGIPPELRVLVRDRAGLRAAAEEAGLRVLAASATCWSDDDLVEEARALGFPFVIKPAFEARDPRTLVVIEDDDELAAWLRDALDLPVVLERHVDRPRHVEVVFVGDGSEVIVLGEVETSARKDGRRVLAESPAPAVDGRPRAASTRSALWAAAADLATYLGFRGVGSVQFLFDAQGAFHFVGLRPQLGPEHALIEMCTGVDLVEVECLLALGEAMPRSVRTAESTGHSVQARLEASVDPRDGRPFAGRVEEVRWPPAPTGKVRIETGVQPGSRVEPSDDPVVAVVSTFAPTRHEAVLMLDRVVAETRIAPLVTNLRLVRKALNLESFRALQVDESTLDRA